MQTLTFGGREVASSLQIPYRTLMSWVARGLLSPVHAHAGRRKQTVWYVRDIEEAAMVVALRRANYPFDEIEEMLRYRRATS